MKYAAPRVVMLIVRTTVRLFLPGPNTVQADTDRYESCLNGCSIMENSFTSSSGEVDCDRANKEMPEQCGKRAPGNDGPCFAILEKWVGITGCM